MYREKGLEPYKGTMKDFLGKIKLEYTKENKKDRLKSGNEYDFNCLVTNVYVNDSNLKYESISLLKMKMSIN
tara:strand:- start:306 stop:521 length:216 start_codon:yes stop_codon:yes gene_type:complete